MLFGPLKLPAARILPSGWTASTRTEPFAFGSKVGSSVPSGFSRAIRLRVTATPPLGERVVKEPPTRILPSAWSAIALTVLFAFGSNAASTVPSGLSRAMRLRVTGAPPLGESVPKLPPIRILPSGCTTTARMRLFTFGSKPSSADWPRVVGTPARSTATENSNSPVFLTLPIVLMLVETRRERLRLAIRRQTYSLNERTGDRTPPRCSRVAMSTRPRMRSINAAT
jgi:hypothetical protein